MGSLRRSGKRFSKEGRDKAYFDNPKYRRLGRLELDKDHEKKKKMH
jgi:hypothetical protein